MHLCFKYTIYMCIHVYIYIYIILLLAIKTNRTNERASERDRMIRKKGRVREGEWEKIPSRRIQFFAININY